MPPVGSSPGLGLDTWRQADRHTHFSLGAHSPAGKPDTRDSLRCALSSVVLGCCGSSRLGAAGPVRRQKVPSNWILAAGAELAKLTQWGQAWTEVCGENV